MVKKYSDIHKKGNSDNISKFGEYDKKRVKEPIEPTVIFQKFIKITTQNRKKISADIVINVSGPVSLEKANREVIFINSLKKLFHNFNNRGFTVNKDFLIGENIYAPGTISSNFNPNRLTIIKAITMINRNRLFSLTTREMISRTRIMFRKNDHITHNTKY